MTALVARRDVLRVGAGLGLLPAVSAYAAPGLRTPVLLNELEARDVLNGKSVKLLRDVAGERTLVLSFFFTGCSTVCPLQSQSLSGAQKLLPGVLGKHAVFASVSIDWWGDTPAAIRAFARRNNAGPHWHFLKAPPEKVDQLRRGLDAFDSVRDNHPPVIFVGKVGAAQWSRMTGAPAPATLANEVKTWAA